MKIDKRACRQYEKQQIHVNKNNGLLYVEDKRYIVRTFVKNISGKRLLILYFCPIQEQVSGVLHAKYIVFQAKDEYATLEMKRDGTYKWRSTRTLYLDGAYRKINETAVFYTHSEEERVIRFCKNNARTGFSALGMLQARIAWKRTLKRRRAREQKIKDEMKNVCPLPEKTLQTWLLDEVAPAHIFYGYQKGKKIQTGYCTHCHSMVSLHSPRHGKEYVCPSCGWTAKCHATGRIQESCNSLSFLFMQKYGNEILVRVCKADVLQRYEGKTEVTIRESSRLFLSLYGKTVNYREYYNSYEGLKVTPWMRGKRPIYRSQQLEWEASEWGHLYTKNLAKVLQGTPWEYSQIGELYLGDRLPVNIYSYFSKYMTYPVLEYLVKLRLFNLTRDILEGKKNYYCAENPTNLLGKDMKEVLGVEKQYIPIMQEANVKRVTFGLMKELLAFKVPVNAELLLWCQQNAIFDAEDLQRCLKYTTSYKMTRYIKKQIMQSTLKRQFYSFETDEKFVFGIYKDYIKMCENLEYNLYDDFIAFPRNLKEAHDRASEMFDEKKVEIYDKKIMAQHDALAEQYQMEKFGFLIRPPKTSVEIVDEGNELHHCVGGYVSQVAAEKTTILFLRKTDDLENSFYTIEVKNGRLVQIRGDGNCGPTPEVQKFVQVWKQEKLQSRDIVELAA